MNEILLDRVVVTSVHDLETKSSNLLQVTLLSDMGKHLVVTLSAALRRPLEMAKSSQNRYALALVLEDEWSLRPVDDRTFSQFLIRIGWMAAVLSDETVERALLNMIASGKVSASFIAALRDRLQTILVKAELEKQR